MPSSNETAIRGLRVGQFVTIQGNEHGVGKVSAILTASVQVEYFRSPSSEPTVLEVSYDKVRPIVLEEQTRVYFCDPVSGDWRVGRALGPLNKTRYRVQFPNRVVMDLDEARLHVRWRTIIDDPTDFLAYRLNETPIFHSGRCGLVASLVEQRRYSQGMSGLLSSSISLEEHQVEVVQRVLQDPVQRYLLADEVGLGKTIEAGILIRQFLLDGSFENRAIILIPDHLVGQWTEELEAKFHLGPWLMDRVILIPHSKVEEVARYHESGCMLVVDEAHHIAALAVSRKEDAKRRFGLVSRAAHTAASLLLLSATPVLHNEQGFLAMLHLLDPATYALNGLDAFRNRVRLRQEVAELFMGMTEDQQNYFLSEQALELLRHFPEDRRLRTLVEKLTATLDEDPPEDDPQRQGAIRAIRVHVSETYRLHRRILRNRRTKKVQVLLPGRAGLDVRCYEDSSEKQFHDLVDEWRLEAALASESLRAEDQFDLLEVFRRFFGALLTDRHLLHAMVTARTGMGVEALQALGYQDDDAELFTRVPLFEVEMAILARLEMALKTGGREERLHELESLLGELVLTQGKVVVFTSHEVTADRVYAHLAPRFKKEVVRFRLTESGGTPDWYRFRTDSTCTILVCGPGAEEGLNLQGRRVMLVHYDLPLSPNRLEQRIGRLDRYGTGSKIQSFALLEGDCELIEGWYNHLDLGYRIFSRSVASLQYLIEEQLQRLWPEVLNSGMDAFGNATEALEDPVTGIERELRRIRSQDELDSMEILQPLESEGEGGFEDRFEPDERAADIRRALDGWVVRSLQFKSLWAGVDDHNGARYQYREGETLLPFRDYLEHFAGVIDPEEAKKRRFVSHILSYRRQQAVQHRRQIARIGTPFIDAMSHVVRSNDRGISFAFWRWRHSGPWHPPAEVFFRFDYLVEGDTAPACTALESLGEGNEQAVVRRLSDSLFQPVLCTLWLDEELRVVTDEGALAVLREPYDKYSDMLKVGRDFNLNADRWRQIEGDFPPASWRALCLAARTRSEELLLERTDLLELTRSCAERARRLANVRQEQMKSRLAQLKGPFAAADEQELERDNRLSAALEQGILRPSIRLDSLGAIFLSTTNPFAE